MSAAVLMIAKTMIWTDEIDEKSFGCWSSAFQLPEERQWENKNQF